MADYVERDGDWVLRPPGVLNRVTMTLFVLRASRSTLARLARRFIDEPSDGDIKASVPLGMVLLTCAEIEYGYSDDPTDRKRGFMTERDVGFFVPTLLTGRAGIHPVVLLPYLYVDNFAAVLIGREIYGFPKVFGEMTFIEEPAHFEVRTLVSETQQVDRCVVTRAPIVVRETRRRGSRALRPGTLLQVTAAMHRHARKALGHSTRGIGGFAQVPMAFLKEFRDVASPTVACYQGIVRAAASIRRIRSPRILFDDYEVDLPDCPSLHIAEQLGLTGSNPYRVKAAFRLGVDFVLPYGETLWQAP